MRNAIACKITIILISLLPMTSTKAACPGSTSNLFPEIRQFTNGSILQCVQRDREYRLSITGPSSNTSYCLDAVEGFTQSSSSCLDATNGDISQSRAYRIRTDPTISTAGITGKIQANQCSDTELTFQLPACTRPSACVNLPIGARSMWMFEEPDGTRLNNEIYDVFGILVNGPLRTEGFINQGLDFDGVDDHAYFAGRYEHDIGTRDFSTELWIRTTDNHGVIFAKLRQDLSGNRLPGGYELALVNGALRLTLSKSPFEADIYRFTAPTNNIRVNDGTWHHLVFSLDRDQTDGAQLYIDGQQVAAFDPTPLQGARIYNWNHLTLAASSAFRTPRSRHLDAQIDEFTIYNRALYQPEIQAIYNAGINGKCGFATIIQDPLFVQLACVQETLQNGLYCNANVSGGSGQYTYQWNNDGGGFLITHESTADVVFCSGQGTVSVAVSDGQSDITRFHDYQCSEF